MKKNIRTGRVLSFLVLLMTVFAPSAPAQSSDAVLYVATYVDVQLNSTNQGIGLIKQYRDAGRRHRAFLARLQRSHAVGVDRAFTRGQR